MTLAFTQSLAIPLQDIKILSFVGENKFLFYINKTPQSRCIQSFIDQRQSQYIHHIQSKKAGKGQESIQSNTTPDPGHHMGK